MAIVYHVHGAAKVYIGAALLGYSVDGIQMDFNHYYGEYFSDDSGPSIPGLVLQQGSDAKVTCRMIKYDLTVMESVSRGVNNGTFGVNNNTDIGDPIAQCNQTFALNIQKTTLCHGETEGDWKFPSAYLVDTHSVTVGTRATEHILVFRCLPNASGVLFTKT